MDTFLGRLCDELMVKHGQDFSGVTVVFPTRRAGLFFRAELSTRLVKPVWAPRVLAIQDLMLELAGKSLPDPITQLFELFEIYHRYFPDDTFDHYYPWGEVMLKDFEELDKSLANASKVFSVIADMKEIDSAFGLDDVEMERLKSFWQHFFNKEHTRLKDEFAQTWKHLHTIYNEFHERLDEKGWSTEGRAFRMVADQCSGKDTLAGKIEKEVVFAGLYALSKSEERVVEYLMSKGKASIYWDADRHYIDDTFQEAGLFLRSSALFNPHSSNWIEDRLRKSPKEIEVIGVPMEVGQAKIAGELVAKLLNQPGFNPERTAVILPDENLLFPVLYSLPSAIEKINVTMGYPLHQTPIYYLFESLINLQKNVRPSSDVSKSSFYFKDVQSLLDHPYIRMIDPSGIRTFSSELNTENLIRVKLDRLRNGSRLFEVLFKPVKDSITMFAWCREILQLILESMQEKEFSGHTLESEFIARFFTQLNRLEEIYASVAAESTVDTWWGLLRQIIHATKIPFAGEPLEGLQVMGFLESRVLDFENVILLSVNEDILPASAQHPSFIPYGIRKAFGLPTHEDQHAVTAYHFYRLLQRPSRIWLIHNTESHSLTSGEPSRFIVQLEEEVAKKTPDTVKWNRKIVSTPVIEQAAVPIIIEKNAKVLAAMDKWFIQPGAAENPYQPRLSPSAINNYIACPLRFYFSSVAGLKEPEQRKDELEKALLGKVLHKTMQLLYMDYQSVTESSFMKILEAVDKCLDRALTEEFQRPEELEGKNILLRNVIRKLVLRILELDRRDAPFDILQLEQSVTVPFAIDEHRTVGLMGIIDRVDGHKDGLRVLDYKTGVVEFKDLEDVCDVFTMAGHKEQFQAIYYAMLIRHKFPGKPVRVGLITLREMNQGVKFVNKGHPLEDEIMRGFEIELRKLITEILDPAVPFTQTEDESHCKYCPYKEICGR